MLERQIEFTKWANDRADENERMWLNELDRRSKFADEHSGVKLSASHAMDASGGAKFYCQKCSYQWPCPSFSWANGRDFELLTLVEKKQEEV